MSTYTIQVAGHLDHHWSSRLGDLAIRHDGDGTTVLTGPIVDQAHLHGTLAGLRDIGATLLSLHTAEPRPVLERPLRTARLTLRPASAEDADPTWSFRRFDPVNEWLTGCPADIAGYRALFNDPARLATTVIVLCGHTPDATVIGDFMLRRENAPAQLEVADQARDRQAELGWVLDPAHGGHGYATEAVRELLRHCFDDLGIHRVTASCFLDNDTSWRLMERAGMRRETHTIRGTLHRSGRWLDTVAYALLADEWTRRQ